MTNTNLSTETLLRILSQWNRWGEARLESGQPREVVDQLGPFLDTPEIVALIGPRRAGKTTVLFQIMDGLEAAGVTKAAMLHVNLEEPALGLELSTDLLERLYTVYRTEIFPEGQAWLFLDEVQRVDGWERWVRARNDTEDVRIFVTGSSSALMAPELATVLTGRHVTFPVLPLSFREFLRFRGIDLPGEAGDPPRMRHAVAAYLRWGGFPEVVLTENEVRKKMLLQQYFDDILFKDVALRHRIRDLPTLRNLAIYLLDQTASLISLQRLARIFEISVESAGAYCGYLEEAFLVSFAPFYTLKTAERVRRPRKVHAVDPGLRNAVSMSASPDRGRLMETVAHNALAAEEQDGLFYWRDEGEVDLVVRQGVAVKKLVQVTEGLTEPAVRQREVRSLVLGAARFPEAETVLVTNVLPPVDAGELGVPIVSLWRFLVGKTSGRETRATEPASQKVLQHLQEHGRVTRREVAELCDLSSQQASRLLSGLLEEGQITRHGIGRGTWYALPT
jgi:predicted AAA+ superfamily ATPase